MRYAPSFVTFDQGKPKDIACKANGNPEPVWFWRKDGRVLDDTTRVLTISQPGNYRCYAQNSFGYASSNNIQVVMSKRFDISEQLEEPFLEPYLQLFSNIPKEL